MKKRKLRKYTDLGEQIAGLTDPKKGGVQAQLAKALGVSQQTVSCKLRGTCAISVADLERLAKKFKKRLRIRFFD